LLNGQTKSKNPHIKIYTGFRDTWAKTVSPNKNVKVYIGAPASSTGATSGYVDANTLGNIAKQTKAQYSSFGGIMLWDASQAFGLLPIYVPFVREC
jgi:chitinase